ncbi:DUF2938 family protein [Mangrovicoccus algicola]|uniref:DUF2938 family protein n=1 Tax=Mangrovicoccus algicola TaxID=2771008 RepID=A0A8J6ZA79_9RHOB|nr:DUF2938 family protein [Mangrovicoccus algicola]MBE3639245.1 DUF2938 family protein [Mangrovicoccus algicola]
MLHLILFSITVGITATLVFDLWKYATDRLRGRSGSPWGLIGRWVLGLGQGRWRLDQSRRDPPGRAETATGWIFHYAVGIAYAAMLPLFWGAGYVAAPGLWPAVIVGFGLTTLAGLCLLTPAMGGGMLARNTPNQAQRIIETLQNHAIFALALYMGARAFA